MLDVLAQESNFNEPSVLACNLQAPWHDNVMKARLIPTKVGLSSCQEMTLGWLLLGYIFREGAPRRFKSRSAASSGNLSMVLQLSPPPGDRSQAFRIKGAKQGVECWKPGTEVLGNLISTCETKRAYRWEPLQKCEDYDCFLRTLISQERTSPGKDEMLLRFFCFFYKKYLFQSFVGKASIVCINKLLPLLKEWFLFICLEQGLAWPWKKLVHGSIVDQTPHFKTKIL